MTLTGRQARSGWKDLVRSLLDSGAMAPEWAESFEAVDRARFLPRMMWPYDMTTRTSTRSDREVEPAAWYWYADTNVPITTQWDDGRHTGTAPGSVPTSSASAPSVVSAMLRDLDVRDGKALEIGTGTGWNAGLLARRLGGQQVTTVEVDAMVARSAKAALHDAGLDPAVVVADGLLGHPQGAPYDRIIATMGLRAVPYAWVRQTVPGGVIVAPWGTHYSHTDAVARLVVGEDGSSASGRFTRPVEFMKARAHPHRLARAPHSEYVPGGDVAAAAESTSSTTLSARGLGIEDRLPHPFPFAAGLLLGQDCVSASDRRGDSCSVWLYGITDRSWAATVLRDGQPASTVYQGGPRRLWDQTETAHRWWTDTGEPQVHRFGLTVTSEGEQAWLDTPRQPVTTDSM
ncbi:methyltransferase domain-containing protein [Streptomyces sp. NPDC052236]|uniref:methyltransferase domain-containing protein n=1 Tax=Streptomyces sp. NPDC052236 TaxID=3365686 RepID=UPI0037D01772